MSLHLGGDQTLKLGGLSWQAARGLDALQHSGGAEAVWGGVEQDFAL